MSIRNSLYLALAVAFGLQLVCAGSASAIATFTRQYKTECSTCHTIYPELNEYGEAFLKNSYVYSHKAVAAKSPVKVKDVESVGAGDSGQVEAAGKEASAGDVAVPDVQTPPGKDPALWLSAIPEILPISFTATLNLAYDDHAQDKFDLSTRALVLQAGGTFRDKASFYSTYTLYSEGNYDPLIKNVPVNNNSDVTELFFIWRHAFDTPVNVRVGRLKPKLSLWKATNKNTATSFAPQIYTVGRSLYSIDSSEDGLEVNSLVGNRVYVAAGVVDRDDQNDKEGYGHISFKIGGSDFRGNEPEVDLESDSIWDYMGVTVGAYGYYGNNAVTDWGGAPTFNNYYYRTGLDMDLSYKRLRTRLSGVYGRDSNPFFTTVHDDIRSLVMAAEAEYLIGSDIIAVFRYEYQDDGTAIHNRLIPAIAYAPMQNTKLILEYKNDHISHIGASSATDNITQLALAFSF